MPYYDDQMEAFVKQAKTLLGAEKKNEWYEDLEEGVCELCPTLTWQQRVIGCLLCLLTGTILAFGSLSR